MLEIIGVPQLKIHDFLVPDCSAAVNKVLRYYAYFRNMEMFRHGCSVLQLEFDVIQCRKNRFDLFKCHRFCLFKCDRAALTDHASESMFGENVILQYHDTKVKKNYEQQPVALTS